jgi:isoquinoline 1-oxidoreductase beta subunit
MKPATPKTLLAKEIDRRSFLRVSALAGGGLMIGFYASQTSTASAAAAAAGPATAGGTATGDFAPNAFVRIASDGTVTIAAHKTEMGQGIITSLPMIVAEELDADWKSVKIDAGRHSSTFPGQATAGSSSTPGSYNMMRQLGAAARAMLVEAAALTWGVPASECTTAAGVVTHASSGRKAGYGELVAKAATLPVPAANTLTLKDPKDFKILGTRVGGYFNPEIVTGKPLFGIDQKTPGMLHAVYVKCPVFGGKPASANLDRIKALPGVKHAFLLEGRPNLVPLIATAAIHLEPGVAIVADSTWSAYRARLQLEVTWDEGRFANDSTAAFARRAAEIGARPDGMTVARNDGDAVAALAGAAKVVEATYVYPFISHANLEPQNTLAHVQGDRAEIWCPTQNPDAAARAVAAIVGCPVGNVKVNIARMGGGFGRRYIAEFAAEAAAISKEVNAPVKLLWSREDDLQHDWYRPAGFAFLKGGVDASGKLIAWHNHFVSYGAMVTGRGGNTSLAAGDGANLNAGLFPARFVPNFRSVQSLMETNVPMGPWRNPGSNAFGFVTEGFVDELAHAAGKDPLQFRLDLLATTPLPNPVPAGRGGFGGAPGAPGAGGPPPGAGGPPAAGGPPGAAPAGAGGPPAAFAGGPPAGGPPAGGRGGGFPSGGLNVDRFRGVLQLAAEKAGWGKRFERGQGAGIAAYTSMQGFAAYVVEVTVSRAGVLKLDRVVAAIDVGRQIVNLSGAEAQVQGSIIDALSAAWYQDLTLDKGRIVQGSFAEYPLLRMPQTPGKIEIHFLTSDNNPSGLGEIGIPPLAPAVANAIFAATGKRIREMPFSKTNLSWS